MSHYGQKDLFAALSALPLEKGIPVFVHSNLGYFGRPDGITSADQLAELFVEAILDRLGPDGTLVVPTFTYSFPRGDVFDPEHSASGMGMFSEYVRRLSQSRRSLDPCYSVAALGRSADALTRDVPENSFSPDSFFGRFLDMGGAILNLNFDAGSTFVHFVERQLSVPYRFDKSFEGVIRENGRERKANSTIWVRYLSDDALEAAFEPLDALARQECLYTVQPMGRGEIGTITARNTYDLIERTLPKRPWFLTKAESLGISTPFSMSTHGTE